MSTYTMADVVRMHSQMGLDENGRYCKACGAHYGHAAETELHRRASDHVAAALSAAGFGLVADAKAEAWDAGHEQGFWNGRLSQKIRSAGDPTPLTGAGHAKAHNPYRAAVRGEG